MRSKSAKLCQVRTQTNLSTMTYNMFQRAALLAALAATTLVSTNVHAANRTWSSTAGAVGFWQTSAAWVGGVAPVAGDDLLFNVAPVAGGTRNVTNDFAPNTQFNSISLINAYVLYGNTINLAGNVTNNGSAAVATVNLNSALQQNSTWFVGASNGRIDVNGDISGAFDFIKSGPGSVRLQTATKTYSGNTVVDAGTLDLNIANALPSGAGKGNVNITAGATLGLRFGQNANALNGSGLITALSSGTKGFTIGNGDASGSYGGVIQNGSGAIALTKVGTGTQILTGANLYTGATTVNGGSLLVNGSTAGSVVTVGVLGTLGGAGTIGGATTVNGTIDPGSAVGVIGTLTDTANLTLSASSIALFQLDRLAGQNADLLSVGGTLSLGGTWNVSNIGTALIAGDLFDLFNATTVVGAVGTLNLPSLDAGLGWDTSLFATTGVITVISAPEPSSLAIVGLSGLAAFAMKRRKA